MKNFGTVNEWEEIMNRRPKGIYDVNLYKFYN